MSLPLSPTMIIDDCDNKYSAVLVINILSGDCIDLEERAQLLQWGPEHCYYESFLCVSVHWSLLGRFFLRGGSKLTKWLLGYIRSLDQSNHQTSLIESCRPKSALVCINSWLGLECVLDMQQDMKHHFGLKSRCIYIYIYICTLRKDRLSENWTTMVVHYQELTLFHW